MPARLANSFTVTDLHSSETQTYARDQTRIVGIVAIGARCIRGRPVFALADEAYIWRDFTPQLVTQAQRDFARRQPWADASRSIRLAVPVQLELRLKDQPLRDQKFVLALEAGRGPSAVGEISGGLQREAMRR